MKEAWLVGSGVWLGWAVLFVILELRAAFDRRTDTPTLSQSVRAYEHLHPWARGVIGGGLVLLFLHWVLELF